jgi:hypothetical protein
MTFLKRKTCPEESCSVWFKIAETKGNCILGLVDRNNNFIGLHFGSGMINSDGLEKQYLKRSMRKGDIICLIVSKDEVRFIVNGIDRGVAFKSLVFMRESM